jgi:hypothetical protein
MKAQHFMFAITILCAALPHATHAQHNGSSNGDESARPASNRAVGGQYRSEWRSQYGQDARNGVSVYTSTDQVFVNNARRFGRNPYMAETAKDLFDHLQSYTRTNGCIPKLTFAGHGWGRSEGGPGLPMSDWGTGLYTDREGMREEGRFQGVWPFRSTKARTLKDLKKLVDRGRVKFCDRCLVQVHSCNVEEAFGESLSRLSGCQVITSAGQAAPVDTRDGSLDHHWISGSDGSGTYSGFYRFTPAGDDGFVQREAIGSRYIAE